MRGFIDPSVLLRTYRDPMAWLSLGVDLLPVIAVLQFGWGAVPLVALYWLENLVIGAVTLLRIAGSTFSGAKSALSSVILIPFFTVHYGLFCFVHGEFIKTFADEMTGDSTGFSGPVDLAAWALSTGPHMGLFVAAIAGVNLIFFLVDFVLRGEFRTAEPHKEMFAPYGRIVTLHVAILLGAALTIGTGQPLLGVLILIMLRVVFGMALSVLRRLRLDGISAKLPEFASTV